jgi:hypothetical protein
MVLRTVAPRCGRYALLLSAVYQSFSGLLFRIWQGTLIT